MRYAIITQQRDIVYYEHPKRHTIKFSIFFVQNLPCMLTAVFYIVTGSIIGVGIWCWIIYEIIKAASYGKKILEEQEMQTLLLVEMARHAGVPEEKIDEIIYEPEEAEPES